MTATASGSSTNKVTHAAVAEAVGAALAGLEGAKASYGFLFAGPNHSLGGALAQARSLAGGAAIVGCTTAGEFDGTKLTHGGVVVLLVAADGTAFASAFAPGLKANVGKVSEELSRAERLLASGRRRVTSGT